MKIDVFSVTFHGRVVDRDEEGNETNSRAGAAEQTVLVGAPSQAEAVALAAVVPEGQEARISHVGNIARGILVSPRALRKAEAQAERAQS